MVRRYLPAIQIGHKQISAASFTITLFMPHLTCKTTRPWLDLPVSPVSTPGQAACLFSDGKQTFSLRLMIVRVGSIHSNTLNQNRTEISPHTSLEGPGMKSPRPITPFGSPNRVFAWEGG